MLYKENIPSYKIQADTGIVKINFNIQKNKMYRQNEVFPGKEKAKYNIIACMF